MVVCIQVDKWRGILRFSSILLGVPELLIPGVYEADIPSEIIIWNREKNGKWLTPKNPRLPAKV
jgi:hypothetical protein